MNLELEKIKNAILYLTKNTKNLYFTKVLKLTYYFDFISVLERGEPVTGDTYYHLPYGPVPTFIKDHLALLKTEVKNEEISISKDSGVSSTADSAFSGILELEQKSEGFILKNKEEPNMSYLSEYEKILLDDIIKDLGQKSATDLVAKTHAEIPYIQTTQGNVINYKLAFYLDRSKILPSRKFDFNIEVSQAEFFNK